MLIGMVLTAVAIGAVQNGPVEGPIAVMDLLIPHRDPKQRLLSFGFSFLIPLTMGGISALLSREPILVAGASTGLGALMSVFASFIRPDTLSPFIQQRLRKAYFIYVLFVISYSGLGILGAGAVEYVKGAVNKTDIVNGLLGSMIVSAFTVAATKVLTALSRFGTSSHDATTEVGPGSPEFSGSAQLAAAQLPDELRTSDVGAPTLPDLSSLRVPTSFSQSAPTPVDDRRGDNEEDWSWWPPTKDDPEGYWYAWFQPSRPGQKGYYYRARFGKYGYFG